MADAIPVPSPIPGPASPAPAPAAAPLTIDEFKKMDLRVAQVLAVEDHPNANKLYVLQIDLGNNEKRQIVAGIKPYYTKESLVGKRIVVVANLKPATLRGVESRGMLLAAHGGGAVIVVSPEKEVPPGSPVS